MQHLTSHLRRALASPTARHITNCLIACALGAAMHLNRDEAGPSTQRCR